jgi:hypothetical protein
MAVIPVEVWAFDLIGRQTQHNVASDAGRGDEPAPQSSAAQSDLTM